MSKHGDLTELRLRLDEAITYGTHREAVKLAKEGLRQAGERDLKGEIEYFKGQIELLNKNFTTAIEHFDVAIKYNPCDGAAYNDRALCMVELGIIDKAFYYFDKGIEVEPDYATIYHNKGWLLNNIGRHTQAIESFKKALTLEPNRAVTYDNLADALFNLSDYQGALGAYRKVLKLLKPGCCRDIRRQIIARIKSIETKILKNKGLSPQIANPKNTKGTVPK
ncbi:MAG: tetratricopeptide repeat protein [Candidatus Omnitrophota bacterium]|nr:tetratricopeptide repeat protein [Candidatus Omnitrophota bacterium]